MAIRIDIKGRLGALLLAVALAVPAPLAHAATEDVDAEASNLQKLVESTAEEYRRATERVEELQEQMAQNEEAIEELDERIEAQRATCGSSVADLYKLHRHDVGLIGAVLSAGSLEEFLGTVEYLNRIHEASSRGVRELSAMLEEREQAQASLQEAQADADKEQVRAERAAAQAVAQREAAQEAARAVAEAEAKARAEQQAATGEGAAEETTSIPTDDGADWSQNRTAFVKGWGARLDAYLAGTPLAGHGATFAGAAWDAGIDPRYSAAISEVESSRGANCYRPHNAWGWGGISWGSWEEAIAAHAVGLARGYGYTVSEEAAKKYCPPNWEHWYSRVSEEMAKI